MPLHPKGDARKTLEALAKGAPLSFGGRRSAWRLERALATLERHGLIDLFPRPKITAKGEKELRSSVSPSVLRRGARWSTMQHAKENI